ncbi:MAG: IS3 family transposase [Candidatus Kapabacteria bacterium]|nr:IS3 family transposase [Candidatus Kapabacteria bacterium]
MMTAMEFIDSGFPRALVLRLVELARSTFYYRPSGGRAGRVPTEVTYDRFGTGYSTEQLLRVIKGLINTEFVDYGYVKVTRWLQEQGLVINKKKTLRLMRSNGLTLARPSRNRSGKTWVKQLVPDTRQPFDCLEFDIKFIRIDGTGMNAMLLTVIDVHSRYVLAHVLKSSIRETDVVKLFSEIFSRYPMPTSITVRSDNGSQFESNLVRRYFENSAVIHEFTRPATPEQNAHIEGYHSVVQRAICNEYLFEHLDQARSVFDRFRMFYNNNRIHSGIDYKTPRRVLEQFNVILPDSDIMPPLTFNQLLTNG